MEKTKVECLALSFSEGGQVDNHASRPSMSADHRVEEVRYVYVEPPQLPASIISHKQIYCCPSGGLGCSLGVIFICQPRVELMQNIGSLVYRTYIYMLFNRDQADCINYQHEYFRSKQYKHTCQPFGLLVALIFGTQ
ncbi:unnamed protein product, partial [Urochloa humidicola]